MSLTGDIASSADVDAAVAQVERDLGRIDVLVNSAGVPGESVRTTEVTDEEWQRVFAINANGSFYMCRAVLPGMTERGYGRIVLVASIAGKEGNPMAAAYSASKAAVIAMTKAIGKDVAGYGRARQLHRTGGDRDTDPATGSPSTTSTTWSSASRSAGWGGRRKSPRWRASWRARSSRSRPAPRYDISGGRAVY